MDSSYFSTKLNSGYFLRPCSKLKSSVVYTACLLKFLWEYGFWRVLIRILSFPASEHFEVTSNSVWEHEHLLDAFFPAFPILFSPSRTFPLHGLICRKFCANNRWTSNRWIELIRGYGWRKNWKIKREISLQFCCLKCLWWINGKRVLDAHWDATFLKFKHQIRGKERRKEPLVNIDEFWLY